jgi:hypothetical protein
MTSFGKCPGLLNSLIDPVFHSVRLEEKAPKEALYRFGVV